MNTGAPLLAASEDTGELVIAVVSDTHSKIHAVYALLEWMRAREREVHVVLHAGDIANLPTGETGPLALSAAEGEASALVSALEATHERVVYVPGNHDAPALFDPVAPMELTVHSHGAHRRTVRLRSDLFVLGVGGCVPGVCAGETVWEGVPYATDAALRDDVVHAWGKRPEGAQLVLLTHCGPSGTCTSTVRASLQEPPILTGATSLAELLHDAAAQDVVCCHVHGHAHAARGMDRVGSVPVINPGSLAEGNFAVLTLRRVPPHNRWAVAGVELHTLPPGATDAPMRPE